MDALDEGGIGLVVKVDVVYLLSESEFGGLV